MGASKKARQVRTAAEFEFRRLAHMLRPQHDNGPPVDAWSIEQIWGARQAQMRGDFALAVRAAEQTRTDHALAVPWWNRLAPQKCIATAIKPGRGARSDTVAGEAEALFGPEGVGYTTATRADIHGCLVDHGVAFAQNVWTPRDDGTRIDVEVRYWPIEFVRWDVHLRMFMARIDLMDAAAAHALVVANGGVAVRSAEVPIVHGDGRWVIFANHDDLPFRKDAAIVPSLTVWARHAFAELDWSKGSLSHGNAKVVGELPEGVPIQEEDEDGVVRLTEEALGLLELTKAIASADTPYGIRPHGSKIDVMANTSTAWQVWEKLAEKAEKAAARIYLGTDGTLGAAGGAPGVDVTALFGVALTRVQGDLGCMSRSVNTGTIEPWCAMNFGSSVAAPRHYYKVPDEDADAVAKARRERKAAFFVDIRAARENGFEVDQEYVDELAEEHDIDAPALAEAKAAALALPPDALASVMRVNEARASAGLGPLLYPDGSPDPDGLLTVTAFEAKASAIAVAPASAARQTPALPPAPSSPTSPATP